MLFAAHQQHLADFLVFARARIIQRRVGSDLAAHDLEIQQLSHERIDHRLEHNGGGGRVFVHMDVDRLAVRRFTDLSRDRLRPGSQPHEAVEQLIHARKRQRRAAENGRDLAAAHTGGKPRDELIRRKFLAGEIFFHQLLTGLRDRLTDGGAQPLQTVSHVRQRHRRRFPVFICIRAVFEQVHIALDLVLLHHGHHDWAHHRAELRFELFEHLIEIRMFAVQLVDKEHRRDLLLLRRLEALFRADGDTRLAGQHDDGAARRADALLPSAGEIEQSRRVEQVDLDVLPRKRQDRRGNRRLAANFLGIEIADRVAVGNLTQSLRFAAQKPTCFGERGFSRAGVADEGDIADFFGGKCFHGENPFRIL